MAVLTAETSSFGGHLADPVEIEATAVDHLLMILDQKRVVEAAPVIINGGGGGGGCS